MSFDRRTLIFSALAAVSGCGFTPAYGPGGGAQKFQGQVAMPVPADRNGYLLTQRLEERFGRNDQGRYKLTVVPETTSYGLGNTSDGQTTRYQLRGTATYILTVTGSEKTLAEGSVSNFTGYSTTGSTVATLAGERDAQRRLMSILADQVMEELLFFAPDLPE